MSKEIELSSHIFNVATEGHWAPVNELKIYEALWYCSQRYYSITIEVQDLAHSWNEKISDARCCANTFQGIAN